MANYDQLSPSPREDNHRPTPADELPSLLSTAAPVTTPTLATLVEVPPLPYVALGPSSAASVTLTRAGYFHLRTVVIALFILTIFVIVLLLLYHAYDAVRYQKPPSLLQTDQASTTLSSVGELSSSSAQSLIDNTAIRALAHRRVLPRRYVGLGTSHYITSHDYVRTSALTQRQECQNLCDGDDHCSGYSWTKARRTSPHSGPSVSTISSSTLPVCSLLTGDLALGSVRPSTYTRSPTSTHIKVLTSDHLPDYPGFLPHLTLPNYVVLADSNYHIPASYWLFPQGSGYHRLDIGHVTTLSFKPSLAQVPPRVVGVYSPTLFTTADVSVLPLASVVAGTASRHFSHFYLHLPDQELDLPPTWPLPLFVVYVLI